MAILKSTISFDVYYEEDAADLFNAFTLEDILYQAKEGDWIASAPRRSDAVKLHGDALQAEMEEIGNDGSFFGGPDGGELPNLWKP